MLWGGEIFYLFIVQREISNRLLTNSDLPWMVWHTGKIEHPNIVPLRFALEELRKSGQFPLNQRNYQYAQLGYMSTFNSSTFYLYLFAVLQFKTFHNSVMIFCN